MLSQHYQQHTLHYSQRQQQQPHQPASHPSQTQSQAQTQTQTSISPTPTATMSGNFANFASLPPEIRTMIWEYSLPEPRVYEVMDVPHAKQKMPAAAGLMFANVHHEPPPPLAAVCRESRGFVLHHYRPLTLGRTTKFVDLARDLLLLEPYLLLKRLHRTLHFMSRIPLIRDHLAGLALGTSYGVYTGICHPVLSWKVGKSNMSKLLTGLAKFPKLKTLLFVVHQEFQFEFDFDARCPPPRQPSPNHVLPSIGGSGSSQTQLPLPPPPPPPVSPPHTTCAGPATPPSSIMAQLRPLPPAPASPPYSAHSPGAASSSSAASSMPSSPGSAPVSAPSAMPYPYDQPPPYHSNRPLAVPMPSNTLQQQLPLPPPPPPSLPRPTTHIHQAQAVPAPQPAAPQSLRPQVVHQAYRFKFDIEGNINRHPRRPHLNELLFYPLEHITKDNDKDDWEALLNNSGGGTHAAGMDGEDAADDETGEWCDPWPTNDDWRRFRRRFQRSVVAALQAGLAGDGQNEFCVEEGAMQGVEGANKKQQQYLQHQQQQQQLLQQQLQQQRLCNGYGAGYNGPHAYDNMYSLHHNSSSSIGHNNLGSTSSRRRRYALRHNLPAIKGASLLWRYTRGD
ncbi:hypothetical protein SPI_04837 [Niveomyces insectorum RCEF 264]|uniref:2EXR domain-containing protein n=1 Tax=Niveomyces insectorum RCEF 264 TaxID=1081102 RepID=A0A167UWJ7_9HYPO|nr:hypothetical protein SPI_04837 [Niveomyces insectorum RCEF 264]